LGNNKKITEGIERRRRRRRRGGKKKEMDVNENNSLYKEFGGFCFNIFP
jgi:hypothetical protein